jgi:argonaute-like protein implicated in RNA metabolism and viral defense
VAYWPQGNGRTEIFHKTIKKYLSYFVNEEQSNWKEILPLIVAAYNNLPH